MEKLSCQRSTTDSFGNVWAASASRYASWDENSGIYTPTLFVGGCGVTVFLKDGKVKTVGGNLGGYYISAFGSGPLGKMWMAVNTSSETIDPVSISMHRKDGTWLHIPYKFYDEKLNKYEENQRDIKAIVAEPKGNVWFGTSAGLKLRKPNGTFQNISIPGLKTPPGIKSMALENGKNLWASVKKPIYLDVVQLSSWEPC